MKMKLDFMKVEEDSKVELLEDGRITADTGKISNFKTLSICLLLCLLIGTWSIFLCMRTIEPKMVSVELYISEETIEFDQKIVQEMDQTEKSEKVEKCDNIEPEKRFDCHPEDGASQLSCTARGCCWDASVRRHNEINGKVPLGVPYCFYPEDWMLYKTTKFNKTESGFEVELKNIAPSYYKKDVQIVKIEICGIALDIIRLKIYDPNNARYEPTWPIRNPSCIKSTDDSMYEFHMDKFKPGFQVKRKLGNLSIFDSRNVGGFIFSDQFLQISTELPTQHIYGLGEHRSSLKLDENWQKFTLFNKDQPPTEHANLYGSHPFLMTVPRHGFMEPTGILFLNSNAMDVILQPGGLTFRSIGGIFDVFLFYGPDPYDVLAQYSSLVGRPFMPPYWSLGFHLCRLGYGTLAKTREVWERNRAVGIPFDTQWNDLDYMNNHNDFTYDKDKFKDLPKFVDELHAAGMHYIPLIDSGISASEANGTYPPYDQALLQDVLIKDSDTNGPFVGKVWNRGGTVWPDFTHPNINDYWYSMIKNMHDEFKYDGVWLDMNEPSNFYNGHEKGCPINRFDNPPYTPNVVGNLLSTKTLCMTAKHAKGLHYDIHNTYGMGGAIASHDAMAKIRQKRPFIVSRSTWVGTGHYSAHWTGDVYSSWHDLRMSIPETLQFSLFQIPMVGADICGFDGNTTVELCSRWMQVGAFYPFSRNHNSDDTIEQDPKALGDIVVNSAKKALTIRYRLLPYLYTLFYLAHTSGSPVMSPLFLSFWTDRETLDIDTQFLWGKSLMIVPVLEEGKIEVKGYLPKGIWYNYYNNTGTLSNGQWFMIAAPSDTIPLFIRDGSIIPAQTPGQTTTESRKNKFQLIITIPQDDHADSVGSLYWDDGDSLDSVETNKYVYENFTVSQGNTLKNELLNSSPSKFDEAMILGQIEVMGVLDVAKVTVDGQPIKTFVYDKSRRYLIITELTIDLKKKFVVKW